MKKRYWGYAAGAALFALFLFSSGSAREGAAEGLRLWGGILVPSLLPYFAAAGLLTRLGAIDALADVAVAVNSTVENIGARRLQTVMERVLDEISFTAPDRHGETIQVDADYVTKHVGDLAKNADLSRFIL